MKKLIALSVIFLTTVQAADAQFTKAGGGLGFTSGFPFHQQSWPSNQSTKFDVYAKGIFELSVPIHISPSFTWYFPNITKSVWPTGEEKYVVSATMFDLNGHYVFNSLSRFEFYGLAGLNIMLARRKFVSKFDNNTSKDIERDNALGLNVGAGTYIKVTNQFDVFAEAKYLVSKYDQVMINAGILLNLQWLSRNENSGL